MSSPKEAAVSSGVGSITIRGIESRVATPADWGHAWILWEPRIKGLHLPVRGYYPDISQVPAGIIPIGTITRKDWDRARLFFKDNAVPGLRKLDIEAMVKYEKTHPNKVRQKSSKIDEVAHLKLEWRCHLPDDQMWELEGYYSFNSHRAPLGRVKTRQLVEVKHTPTVLAAPEHWKYDIFHLKTSFERKPVAMEEILVSKESGHWEVTGYTIYEPGKLFQTREHAGEFSDR